MLITVLASALLASLLTKIGEKGIEKAADSTISAAISRTKSALDKKLKKGEYEPIQRALEGARKDLLAQCHDEDQRARVGRIWRLCSMHSLEFCSASSAIKSHRSTCDHRLSLLMRLFWRGRIAKWRGR